MAGSITFAGSSLTTNYNGNAMRSALLKTLGVPDAALTLTAANSAATPQVAAGLTVTYTVEVSPVYFQNTAKASTNLVNNANAFTHANFAAAVPGAVDFYSSPVLLSASPPPAPPPPAKLQASVSSPVVWGTASFALIFGLGALVFWLCFLRNSRKNKVPKTERYESTRRTEYEDFSKPQFQNNNNLQRRVLSESQDITV